MFPFLFHISILTQRHLHGCGYETVSWLICFTCQHDYRPVVEPSWGRGPASTIPTPEMSCHIRFTITNMAGPQDGRFPSWRPHRAKRGVSRFRRITVSYISWFICIVFIISREHVLFYKSWYKIKTKATILNVFCLVTLKNTVKYWYMIIGLSC